MAPLVTKNEFEQAVISNGFKTTPTQAQYDGFKSITEGQTNWKLKSKGEAAMFLANVIHETGGLVHKKETSPPHSYRDPPQGWDFSSTDLAMLRKYPNNQYYGRGYLQLSWLPNYRQASEELYPGDKEKLVRDPDLVLNEGVAWLTSIWFWRTNVWGRDVSSFEDTIKKINPAVEQPAQREHRIGIYKKVCTAFGVESDLKA